MGRDHDVESELWRERWREGRTGFHLENVNGELVRHAPTFLAGGPHRVLVPLCGKTLDLAWLAGEGHDVVGVEVAEEPVREFFREHDLEPEIDARNGVCVYSAGAITIVRGDIFEVDRSLIGPVTRVWDRAALIALPGHLRGDYTRRLRQLAAPGWAMLLCAVEYDPTVMSGPPWSVSEEEIRRHYPGSEIEILTRRDVIDDLPTWRERGHAWWIATTYAVRDLPRRSGGAGITA